MFCSKYSQIKTDTVYWNDVFPPDEALVTELTEVHSIAPLKILKPGDTVRLSKKVNLRVLKNTHKGQGLNDNGLVLGLESRGNHYLITGDIGLDRQKNLAQLESQWLKKVRWMQWPHHGDRVDSTLFNQKKKMEYCVISVGENDHSLPISDLDKVAEPFCRTLLRTDKNGSLTFSIGRRIQLGETNPSLLMP